MIQQFTNRAVLGAWVFVALASHAHGQRADAGPRPSPQTETHSAKREDPRVWRVMNKCPSNSLYIFLNMLGKTLDYQDLEHDLPVDQSGTSLADMRRCADSFGVRTTVLKLTPEDLPHCPVPAILHCEEERAITGHYVILLAATADYVEYADGTTAMMDLMPMSEFRKKWSGYALVPEERPWWSPLLPAMAVLGALSLCLGVLTRYFRHGGSATFKQAATHNET